MPAYVPPALRAKLKAEAEKKAKETAADANSQAQSQPSTGQAEVTSQSSQSLKDALVHSTPQVAAEDRPLPAVLVLREPTGPPPGVTIAGFSHTTPSPSQWQERAVHEAEQKRAWQKARAELQAKDVEELEREARYPGDVKFHTDTKTGRTVYSTHYLSKHFFGGQGIDGTVSFFRNETEDGKASSWSYFERPGEGGLPVVKTDSWDEMRDAIVSARRARWEKQSKRAEKYWKKAPAATEQQEEVHNVSSSQADDAAAPKEGKELPKDEELLPPREEANLRALWEHRQALQQKAKEEGKPALVSRINIFQPIHNPLFKHPDVGVVREAVLQARANGGDKELPVKPDDGSESGNSHQVLSLPTLEGAEDGEIWFRTNVDPMLPREVLEELSRQREQQEQAKQERAQSRREAREKAKKEDEEAGQSNLEADDAQQIGQILEELEVSASDPGPQRPSHVGLNQPESKLPQDALFAKLIRPSAATPNLGRPIPLFAASVPLSSTRSSRKKKRSDGIHGHPEAPSWLGWYEMSALKLVKPGSEELKAMLELRVEAEVLVSSIGASEDEENKLRSRLQGKAQERRSENLEDVWARVALKRVGGGDKAQEREAEGSGAFKQLEDFKDRPDELERYMVELAQQKKMV